MITSVKAKNFLSWESLNFNVVPGVTLIDGWNEDDQTSEGSGKSAILNAISWCLYGKLPKDAKIDDVIKHGANSCVVAVALGNTTVIRSRKPNDLCMVGADGEVVKGKDAKETQDLIEAFIGLTFETFCQTVYFAQNYTKKFITSNQEEKAKILSEVQDLTVFDRARKEVMELLKKEEANLSSVKHNIELQGRDILLTQKSIEAEEQRIAQVYERHEQEVKFALERFNSAEAECATAEATLRDLVAKVGSTHVDQESVANLKIQSEQFLSTQTLLKSQIQDVDKLVRARTNSETRGGMLAGRYKDLQRQKELNEEFIKNPTSTCPTCNSTLNNCNTDKAERELASICLSLESTYAELESIAAELEQPVPTKEGLTAELNSIVDQRLKVDVQLANFRTLEQDAARLKGQITSAELALTQKTKAMIKAREASLFIKDQRPEISTQNVENAKWHLESLVKSREENIALVNKMTEHSRKLETLKEGFKEVKSFVFNSMLNEINARVHQYLSHLFEVPVTVRFRNDQMKIETDITFNGVERGLGLLSGGQFRRVSLAVDLALSDVITARKGSTLGVLVLDEYFKDLSESSMEKCLTLLEGRGQPVLLIEHNSIFKNIVNNSFTVKLEGGTSRVEV